MSDHPPLLDRYARWQKDRAALSWPEKIRMAERLRESVRALKRTAPARKAEPTGNDTTDAEV